MPRFASIGEANDGIGNQIRSSTMAVVTTFRPIEPTPGASLNPRTNLIRGRTANPDVFPTWRRGYPRGQRAGLPRLRSYRPPQHLHRDGGHRQEPLPRPSPRGRTYPITHIGMALPAHPLRHPEKIDEATYRLASRPGEVGVCHDEHPRTAAEGHHSGHHGVRRQRPDRPAVSPWPHVPWNYDAIGTAEWTGTPLRAALEEAGLQDDAVEILFTGDKGIQGQQVQYFQRSLSIEQAMNEDDHHGLRDQRPALAATARVPATVDRPRLAGE